MKKKILAVGAIALMFTVGLNVQHALKNYGIEKLPLHNEVLAQTNSSGGGGTSGGDQLFERDTSDCVITVSAGVEGGFNLLGFNVTSVEAEGLITIAVHEVLVTCKSGGPFLCSPMECGQFWIAVRGGSGTGT